jgi:hypothetical protein
MENRKGTKAEQNSAEQTLNPVTQYPAASVACSGRIYASKSLEIPSL